MVGASQGRAQDLGRMLAEAQARIAQLGEDLRVREQRDPVTGLATLERFRTGLELEAGRARRYGRDVAVAVIDVDDFRALMARHGHAAGDEVLRQVARALEGQTRATDIACRGAGDEFAVLLPETDLPAAEAFCERMLLELE